MPGPRLLCTRPLFRELDHGSARFVVAKACGLTVNGQHLEMGQEVPPGTLNRYALECEYQTPLARIDELNYALTIDGLREQVERYVMSPEARPDRTGITLPRSTTAWTLYGLETGGTPGHSRER